MCIYAPPPHPTPVSPKLRIYEYVIDKCINARKMSLKKENSLMKVTPREKLKIRGPILIGVVMEAAKDMQYLLA
jgi:hypothetical protein